MVGALLTANPPSVESVSIDATAFGESTYYPANGELPESGPGGVPTGSSADQCDSWSEWVESTGAAPVDNQLNLILSAYDDTVVDIVSVTPHVYGTFELSGPSRLRCSTLDRTESSPDYLFDLSGSNSSTDRGFGTVSISGPDYYSMPLLVELRGAENRGYEYGVTVEIAVDGESTTISLGPYQTVFDGEAAGQRYYDWDTGSMSWLDVTGGS